MGEQNGEPLSSFLPILYACHSCHLRVDGFVAIEQQLLARSESNGDQWYGTRRVARDRTCGARLGRRSAPAAVGSAAVKAGANQRGVSMEYCGGAGNIEPWSSCTARGQRLTGFPASCTRWSNAAWATPRGSQLVDRTWAEQTSHGAKRGITLHVLQGRWASAWSTVVRNGAEFVASPRG